VPPASQQLPASCFAPLGADESTQVEEPSELERILKARGEQAPPLHIPNGFSFKLALASASTIITAAHHHQPDFLKFSQKRFKFDPIDKLAQVAAKKFPQPNNKKGKKGGDPAFVAAVRALTTGRDPDAYREALETWQSDEPGRVDIFQALWPYCKTDSQVLDQAESRIILGVAGTMAALSTVSPLVRRLLDRAPKQPIHEFHVVNAVLSVIKLTAGLAPTELLATPMQHEAAKYLLGESLKKIASLAHSDAVPEEGRPAANAPFPSLSRYIQPFIDRLACTPRIVADFHCSEAHAHLTSCESDDHRFGCRVYGDFSDALRVAPDETDTLADILAQCEAEILNVEELVQDPETEFPATCNEGHSFALVEHNYGLAPPPLLIFEATSSNVGIPRECITPQVALTTTTARHDYDLVAIVSAEILQAPGVDDVVLEFFPPAGGADDDSVPVVVMEVATNLRAAYVFYVQRLKRWNADVAEVHLQDEDDEDDEEEDEEEDFMDLEEEDSLDA
jgi:hypothetical protein